MINLLLSTFISILQANERLPGRTIPGQDFWMPCMGSLTTSSPQLRKRCPSKPPCTIFNHGLLLPKTPNTKNLSKQLNVTFTLITILVIKVQNHRLERHLLFFLSICEFPMSEKPFCHEMLYSYCKNTLLEEESSR